MNLPLEREKKRWFGICGPPHDKWIYQERFCAFKIRWIFFSTGGEPVPPDLHLCGRKYRLGRRPDHSTGCDPFPSGPAVGCQSEYRWGRREFRRSAHGPDYAAIGRCAWPVAGRRIYIQGCCGGSSQWHFPSQSNRFRGYSDSK